MDRALEHGRHRALELPARDLVGEAEADLVRFRELHPPVEVDRVALGLLAGHDVVDDGRLGILVDELVGRIEGRRRGLGDIGDARPAEIAALLLGGGAQVDPVEHDGAARDPAAVAGEAHGGEADGGLPRAALADETQNLALVKRQVDALDDLGPFVARTALDAEVPDFQENVAIHRGHSFSPEAR